MGAPASVTKAAEGKASRIHSPWLLYTCGCLQGCMLSQAVRYLEAPQGALAQIVVHTSMIALMAFFWAGPNAYARLWERYSQRADAASAEAPAGDAR